MGTLLIITMVLAVVIAALVVVFLDQARREEHRPLHVRNTYGWATRGARGTGDRVYGVSSSRGDR